MISVRLAWPSTREPVLTLTVPTLLQAFFVFNQKGEVRPAEHLWQPASFVLAIRPGAEPPCPCPSSQVLISRLFRADLKSVPAPPSCRRIQPSC